MGTIFDRVSAMPADRRDALTQQFDRALRIAAAEPVAVAVEQRTHPLDLSSTDTPPS